MKSIFNNQFKISIKKVRVLMFSVFVLLLMASVSWGTEYYVDASNGNDSNAGTLSKPVRTISKAGSLAFSGDSVYVKTGTYYESVTINNSGKLGAPIIFKAYPGDNPIIDGGGISDTKLINFAGKNYIVWDGIDVRNAKGWGMWVEGSYNTIINCKIYNNGVGNGKTGLEVIAGDHNIIRHNEIYNNGWNGLSVESCNYTTIEYNDIHDNAYHMGVNIFTITNTGGSMQTGNNVRYNKIHNNLGAGIYARYQQNFEYVGNLIYRNKYSGIKFTSESEYASTYTCNGKIYNNTIANNGEDGIRSQSGKSLTIKNNIIYGSGSYNINIYSTVASGHSFDYNLFYNPSLNNKWGSTVCQSLSSWQGTSGQDAHSRNNDPLFNNLSGNDYTLKSGSPAIGSGVNLGAAYDKCLDPYSSWPNSVKLLSQGNDWEIGAYIMSSRGLFDPLPVPENLQIILYK